MARSDAIAKTPTIEQEIAKFKGFSTTEGEVSDGAPTARENKIAAVNKDGEAASAQAIAAEPDAASAAGLSETEEAAALDAAQAEKPEGEELTDDEKEAAVAAALTAKTAGTRRRDPEKRIGQAVARQRAAERQLATEREERARERGAFEARLSAIEKGELTATTKTSTRDPNAPNPDDFEFGALDTRYIEALADYRVEKKLAEREAKAKETSQGTTQEAARAEFVSKLATFTQAGEKQFGDTFVQDVIETAESGEWPLSAVMGQLLVDSPSGPAIAHYLSDPANLAEARRLEKLSPTAQAVAFGRLEAKFSSAVAAATGVTKTPVTATKAPPVPAMRARGAGGKSQASADTNDFKAFEAMAMGKPN